MSMRSYMETSTQLTKQLLDWRKEVKLRPSSMASCSEQEMRRLEVLLEEELKKVIAAAKEAYNLGLEVKAGHGLNYFNVSPIAAIPEIEELSIGHSIVARAVLVGMERAVREMIATSLKRMAAARAT